MINGIVDANEEVTIAAEAGGRSPSDMRNEMPRFLKKIMAGDTRIRGMLIITSDVILQGIKQGVFTVQRVTNSNAYLEIEGTNLMLLKIQWKHGGDLYKIVDTDMIDNLALYGWHYARGEKEPYSCIKKNKKLILSRHIKNVQTNGQVQNGYGIDVHHKGQRFIECRNFLVGMRSQFHQSIHNDYISRSGQSRSFVIDSIDSWYAVIGYVLEQEKVMKSTWISSKF